MVDDCVFCKIVAGEIPARIVDEDEQTLAFMDIMPATRGHALVIPKRHAATSWRSSPTSLLPSPPPRSVWRAASTIARCRRHQPDQLLWREAWQRCFIFTSM